MKLLWQKVIPMLRCWRILVLLKMMVDFEDMQLSTMEKMVACPEAINPCQPARPTNVAPNRGGGVGHDVAFQF
jgi:hypothetical protein